MNIITPNNYDVFISYSSSDKEIAEELNQLLQNAGLTCFMASKNIKATDIWEPSLRRAIQDSYIIIIILTPRSKNSRWVIAEAGAAWALEKKVVPVLQFIKPNDLIEPINKFQSFLIETELQKIELINDLSKQCSKTKTDDVYDLFLAAPMASCRNENQYQTLRSEVMKVSDAFQNSCGFNVYCALASCPTMKHFDTRDVSIIKDLRALKKSRYFVLIYPKKLHSSVIFEAGYAIAHRKFSLYFVTKRKDLPFMLQDAAGLFSDVRLHEISCSHNFDCIVEEIERFKTNLFLPSKSLP